MGRVLAPLGLLLALAGVAGAEERPIVAVFDLESRGSGLTQAELEDLAALLRARLAECGFQVVPQAQIRERLRAEAVESYRACYDESCQIELGRELAASAIVSSQVLRLGERCQLTALLYDLGKAAAGQAGVAEAGCSAAELLPAVRAVAETLCGNLPGAARARATSLTVQSEPDGARVVLDGVEVGRAPLTLPVTPGVHRLQASRAGCDPAPPREVELAAGQHSVVRLELEQLASLDPWAHGLFWPGVVLAGLGVLFHSSAADAGAEFNAGDLAEADRSRAWMGGAYAAYVAGGLLLLTGAGLWIAQAVRSGSEPPVVLPAVGPTADGAGAALQLGGRW